jgi:hypothetical protein
LKTLKLSYFLEKKDKIFELMNKERKLFRILREQSFKTKLKFRAYIYSIYLLFTVGLFSLFGVGGFFFGAVVLLICELVSECEMSSFFSELLSNLLNKKDKKEYPYYFYNIGYLNQTMKETIDNYNKDQSKDEIEIKKSLTSKHFYQNVDKDYFTKNVIENFIKNSDKKDIIFQQKSLLELIDSIPHYLQDSLISKINFKLDERNIYKNKDVNQLNEKMNNMNNMNNLINKKQCTDKKVIIKNI